MVYDATHDRGWSIARQLNDLRAVLSEAPPPADSSNPPIESVLYLVGLGDSLQADTAVTDWITHCRRTAPVIAYGYGIASWPVRSKAALLLAGCTALVDLARADAGRRLRNVAASILARELSNSEDHRAAIEALAAGGLIGERRDRHRERWSGTTREPMPRRRSSPG